MKKLLLGLAAAAFAAASASAADFGPKPANFEAAAEAYLSDRLSDPRSARYQVLGEPYQVFADIAGYEGLPCWAIDVRVKARVPGGASAGYVPYTVIFLDGEPIAVREDARRMVRADI